MSPSPRRCSRIILCSFSLRSADKGKISTTKLDFIVEKFRKFKRKKKKGVGFFFKYVEFVISTSVCLYFDRNCMKYRQGPELQCSCRPKYVYV